MVGVRTRDLFSLNVQFLKDGILVDDIRQSALRRFVTYPWKLAPHRLENLEVDPRQRYDSGGKAGGDQFGFEVHNAVKELWTLR